MNNYKQLDAWKASMELITEIYTITKRYPKEETYALTSQTKRAAVSIAANIAEGLGRQHKKDTLQLRKSRIKMTINYQPTTVNDTAC